MKYGFSFLLLLLMVVSATAQERVQPVKLGRDTGYIVTIKHKVKYKGVYFIHLHENEQVALRAGKHFTKRYGGTLITLTQHSKRNLIFADGDSTYIFDPNRIFSEIGRDSTLRRLSSVDDEAKEAIKRFADSILAIIRSPALVVALHNNTRGLPLSINTYTLAETADIYINPKTSEDDFVLTTNQKIFDYIRSKKINVVLQYAGNTSDDGSLSIYYSLKGIPYINIETEQSHYRRQKRILRKLKPLILDYYHVEEAVIPNLSW